ncbi:Molybdenum enzyme related to thiosulfate reductase and polysulfide reductase, large subunit [Aromatoleum aromaticum EbN1]|uniref:Molybdenum enzyme related to thiosulfate reductase and polysulfide reductase, large subunit n=1 Tax=Aromatoleum aromaticum (strain DSM 19018 / LMG 30748 / EbN1) TaxID=76114 RepID=Q5NYR2_AROAE|nr:molybdopterin-dependent oxidoreductase [Aromatoleum aromaticum]CAI09802.1 Molybdenum enzyme related to thiosulfate reductase and polysulfide reductase, large subunit [Aromatoleum aromaticum EbN1]
MDFPKITRRTFLQVSAGTTAAAAAAPRLLHAMENELGGKDFNPANAAERKAIPVNCHVCNIQDGAIAYVENDRVVKLEGNPEHVSTRGRLCAKGNSGMWYSYDPDRILYPLKRIGARGEGKWKRITWDEALTEVAGKLDAALKEDPNTIMLKWGRNRTGGTLERFMKTLGSATVLNHTSVCESSKKVGQEPTWGPDIETPDFANAKYVLNFGSNILEAAYFHNPLSQRVTEGRVDNHMKIVTFDVRLSNTAGFSDEWIPVFPATDGAVALAIGHVILREDLQDSEFIDTWTNVTVDELKAHYAQYTPEWASKISGVPVQTIERIAREFATTKPATLFTYRGPAKHLYGSYNEKACMMLPIITGNVEKRGGYCLPRGMGWPQPMPQPPGPTQDSVLAHPPEYPLAAHKVSHLVPFWIAEGRQKINVAFTYQDNPVYTNPGAQAVWGKLYRDEKLIPYFISMSSHMGEETALADIILPDCPYLERWEPESMPNSLWPWLGIRQPVHKSLGESRENRVLLRDIIWKLDPDGSRGMKQFWEFKDGEDYMRHHFDNVPGLKEAGGLDFLKKHGVWPIYGTLDPRTGKVTDKTGREIQAEYSLYKKELSATDMEGAMVDAHGLITKNGKAIGIRRNGRDYVGFPTGNRLINVRVDEWAEYGFNPMPTFKRIPWHETMKDDEMILSTFKLNVHKQSRTAAVKWLAEIAHSNPAWMNPETAKKLGVRTGDLVRVESSVGYLVTKAYVTEGIHPKVISIATGFGHWEYGRLATLKLKDKPAFGGTDDPDLDNVWWDDRGVHPNAIIPVVADPIGGSQGWYDTVVKVSKAGPDDKYGDIQGDWDKHYAAYKETMRYAYTGDLHRRMHPEMAAWAGPESVKPKASGGH